MRVDCVQLVHTYSSINMTTTYVVYSYNKYAYIHIYAEYIMTQWIKTSEDFFRKICTSYFIIRVRKGLLKVFQWDGVGDTTKTATFWPPLLWPSALSFSFSRAAQSEAQRPTQSDVPRASYAGWWLPLPHLVSNSSDSNSSDFPFHRVI